MKLLRFGEAGSEKPGLLDDEAFWMMHQALEPNGFICASPGQGRLCGRRPG